MTLSRVSLCFALVSAKEQFQGQQLVTNIFTRIKKNRKYIEDKYCSDY